MIIGIELFGYCGSLEGLIGTSGRVSAVFIYTLQEVFRTCTLVQFCDQQKREDCHKRVFLLLLLFFGVNQCGMIIK